MSKITKEIVQNATKNLFTYISNMAKAINTHPTKEQKTIINFYKEVDSLGNYRIALETIRNLISPFQVHSDQKGNVYINEKHITHFDLNKTHVPTFLLTIVYGWTNLYKISIQESIVLFAIVLSSIEDTAPFRKEGTPN